MSRMGTVAAVCVVAALAFASTRLGAQDDAAREARDRAQIDELMWKYVRALDTLSADAYAANYTPDGSFGATKGRDALKKMVADLAARRADAKAKGEPPPPPMFHVVTNPYLSFTDKDHAIMRAYWMTIFGAAGEKVPPRVAAAGRSIDHLVRVNGRWLIQSRDVAPKEE
jgi:hypothetical protein